MLTSPVMPSREQLSVAGGVASVQRTMALPGLALGLVAWKKAKARVRIRGGGATGHGTELAPFSSWQLPLRAMGTTVSACVAGASVPAVAVSTGWPAWVARKATVCWLAPMEMVAEASGTVHSASE